MKIYIIFFLILLSHGLLFSQWDVNSVQEKLNAKYGNVNTLITNFSQKGNSKLNGSLTAKEGNKFKIQIEDKQIISNGTTIWIYSEKEKRVVISNFDESAANNSLERVFYKFIELYKVTKISKEQKSNKKTLIIAELEPIDRNKIISSIIKLTLWLEPNDFSIEIIKIQGDETEFWNLNSLILNKKIPDKFFEFKPPKDCEVVDIR
jgi:outer membrane lipoprotein-sorting protein